MTLAATKTQRGGILSKGGLHSEQDQMKISTVGWVNRHCVEGCSLPFPSQPTVNQIAAGVDNSAKVWRTLKNFTRIGSEHYHLKTAP
jgi:hypothetical protein